MALLGKAKHPRHAILPVVLLSLAINAAHAQNIEEPDLALAYGDKSFVSIATGARQPISRAPSVATVITSEDIRAIGARNLEDVLETVPGIHVSRQSLGYTPIYVIRGIYTDFNSQVLILINGVPITNAYLGNRGTASGDMPVDNVARIEIIRGPGSALYGAEAFAGVINVITKSANDIQRTQIGATAGSFDTWDAWTQHGGKWGIFDTAIYLRAGATHGQRETVSADAQIGLDALFGTNTSHAPGPMETGYRAWDLGFELSTGNWHWRNNAQVKRDIGHGAGIASALDQAGHTNADTFLSALSYEKSQFAPNWDLKAEASFFYWSERSVAHLFPPGAFGGAFPDGMIGTPEKWERHTRLGLSTFYTGFETHKPQLGAGWVHDDLYKVREGKNFSIVGGIPTPTGPVADASGSERFLDPHDRYVRYLYVQDEWAFAKDWFLTAGVRHDDYSDFGGTTNPRLALVWEAAYNLTAKLLYGRAFRAPSFVELYVRNNPVASSNPNLRPETIETSEAALVWHPRKDVQVGVSAFYYHIEDAIRPVVNPDPSTGFTFQNVGEQIGRGAELEASWDVAKTLRLSGNYAVQRSIDVATHQDAGNAPQHHVYARADWRFAPAWALNTQVNRIAGRQRAPGDTREDIADYTTVDLTLHRGSKQNQWNLAFSIRNLLDDEVKEPTSAPATGGPASIPNDLPMPGRWFLLQARYGL